MKKKLLVLFPMSLFFATTAWCQEPEDTEVWEPVPEAVKPGNVKIEPSSDAIILFDGSSFDEWESVGGGKIEWTLSDGVMTVRNTGDDIKTRRNFRDFQLHLEWRAPKEIIGDDQRRGNSGVFLQERYEVQIMDNWNNPTYSNGMTGSIYKQHIPLVNPAKRPGEWQVYDIFYKAPIFDSSGNVEEPARVTVLLNGVLILNNVKIYGSTRYIGEPEYEAHGPAGIRLQDYPHPGKVSFRNIWIRELDDEIIHSDGISSSSGGR